MLKPEHYLEAALAAAADAFEAENVEPAHDGDVVQDAAFGAWVNVSIFVTDAEAARIAELQAEAP